MRHTPSKENEPTRECDFFLQNHAMITSTA